MNPPFPTREELKARGYSRELLELYGLLRAAHAEGQKLAARLPEVFGSPPRPRITLHVARGYDDEWNLSPARFAELEAMDPEQHWTEVTSESTQSFQEYFAFSDAEGWRFYLPAYMFHYLAEFPCGGHEAVRQACREKKHCDLLSPEQLAFLDEFTALCDAWES